MNAGSKTSGRPAWIEVDLGAVAHNLDIIKDFLSPGSEICAVVKANAYGHGLDRVVSFMSGYGVRNFAVATVEEAAAVRKIAPQAMILVLSLVWPGQIEEVLDLDLVSGVSDMIYAEKLSEAAIKRGRRAKVMAVIDTGMGRIGFRSEEPASVETVKAVSGLKGLELLGLMSHFSDCTGAGPESDAYTDLQEARFASFREKVLAAGVPLPVCSLCNSFGTMTRPSAHYQLCRTGAIIFGSYTDTLTPRFGFLPALSVKALISHIKTVPAGTVIGYNRAAVTERESVIGTVNLGYADGIPRNWGCGNGSVIIRGMKAPLIGLVCMDQLMVDLTDVPGAALFDEVTVIGRSGDLEIAADEMGEKTGTMYDVIVTGLSERLPRFYIAPAEDGGSREAEDKD